jgi:hypothetical protein
MEQHDQLTGWRASGERVKDEPTGGELERFDHVTSVTKGGPERPTARSPGWMVGWMALLHWLWPV